ncbi:MAG: autotransporter assembly complex protein TamA [Alphaproteobacteria bacterium]
MAYETRLIGVDGDLRGRLEETLALFRLRDRPLSGVVVLRMRLEADLDLAESLMRSEGYYGYRIDHRLDAESRPATVEIEIALGPAYRLSVYDIAYLDGPPEGGPPPTLAEIGIVSNAPARAADIVEAQGALLRALGERGYPYAEAGERRVLVDHDAQEVRVSLEVRKGPIVTIGALSVSGQERVDGNYIRLLADLKEGDLFSFGAIDGARRRLFSSGLFDSVSIDWPQSDQGQDQVPVAISVRERDRRSIGGGLSYSTTDGAGIEAGWTHRNLFGAGERLELGARLAEREQSLFADLLNPNVGRLDQNLTARAEYKQSELEAFDQTSVIGALGLQRRLSERWRASLSLSAEATEIEEENKPAQQYLILSLPGQLNYDNSDDFFDPSRGYRLAFDAVPSQALGDSQAQFVLGSVGGSVYRQLLPEKRLVLAGRARIASLAGASLEDIPASRRLYAGGGGSVRGYQHQKVGPLDADRDPTGGRSSLELGFEARFRLFDDYGIVPFIDGGSVSETALPTGGDMQWAAGLGFRYYTAVGPLRIDVAMPLNRRQGVDDAYAFYISLGQSF